MTHNQADVHMLYALVLFIEEEYDEDSSGIAVCIWLNALWLEGVFSNQALQVDEGDLLHVQGAPWQCKADVPEVEGLTADHHVLGQRLWTLEAVQEMFKVSAAFCKRKNK